MRSDHTIDGPHVGRTALVLGMQVCSLSIAIGQVVLDLTKLSY